MHPVLPDIAELRKVYGFLQTFSTHISFSTFAGAAHIIRGCVSKGIAISCCFHHVSLFYSVFVTVTSGDCLLARRLSDLKVNDSVTDCESFFG